MGLSVDIWGIVGQIKISAGLFWMVDIFSFFKHPSYLWIFWLFWIVKVADDRWLTISTGLIVPKIVEMIVVRDGHLYCPARTMESQRMFSTAHLTRREFFFCLRIHYHCIYCFSGD